MGLVIAVLGVACGALAVLLIGPTQVIPRFMHPLRYVVVTRWYRRLQAEFRIRRPFFLLSGAAITLLLLWFFIIALAPLSDELLLSRVVLGIGLGFCLGWTLFCRHELLFGKLGILGFYPHVRMIVTWDQLAGYLLFTEEPRTIVLLNKAGHWVEAIPLQSEVEQREVELSLMPYLQRLDAEQWSMLEIPRDVKRSLGAGYALLIMAALPLLALLGTQFFGSYVAPTWHLIIAILLAVALPFYVLTWSRRFRLFYAGKQGHVSVAQLTTICQRCFYQTVCWQSGLHRRVHLGRDQQARVPSWEEFSKGFSQQPKITKEIYHVCCRCLVGHMRAKDLHQIVLTPLTPQQPEESE